MKTAKELGITQQQFNNLFKLAYYLLEGKLKAKFDINDYDDKKKNPYLRETCGSVGCAIGHGPFAGTNKAIGDNWNTYCFESFGVLDYMGIGWWIFSFYWADSDNTANGAGKRILYYLKYGEGKYISTLDKTVYSGIRLVRKSHSTH